MVDRSLESYEQKRDFEKTPEPAGRRLAGRDGNAPVFVIHRHDARRLHYDLRLEMDGVLKSWAVPKGFSYDPREKKFAVRTEDHPIEYEDFHGLIPSGEYGAGPMTIWDRGTFQLLGDVDGSQAIEDGKLELCLDGGRLRGEWHMVKLKDEKNGWLLFKAKDRYARDVNEPMFAVDVHETERAKFPRHRKFMQPVGEQVGVLDGGSWLYEPKLTGRRVLLEKKGDRIRLRSGQGKDLAELAARVVSEVGRLRAEHALIDGVLVSVDAQGRPDQGFADGGAPDGDPSLYVFDLLYYDEWDLRPFPLSERKAALVSLLPEQRFVRFVDHERMRPDALLEAIAAMGLDGAVAKRADSRYRHRPSEDWVYVRPERVGQRSAPAVSPGKQRVKQTNRHRVLWPNAGLTKGDLIDYYALVSEIMIPYLRDRPLSLNRFPDGIDGKSFFQKGAPAHTPDWIQTRRMDSSNKEGHVNFIICDQRDTLIYLANLAAIELHPWSSRCDTPATPDWAILDLDPYGAPFENIVAIARTIGEILRDAGLRPLVKTSGSKGLHIYVPLVPGYGYDHVRMFCEGVARLAVIRHPETATINRVRSQRVGQVYIDFMQNRRGQTIAAPYSVRPVPGACVSAPLLWDELNDDLRPDLFTIPGMPDRLRSLGDLFGPALEDHQDLLPAIDAIREMLTSD